MKIFGTGIDIVEVARIAKSMERYPDSFPTKILHDEELKELEQAPDMTAFIAKRFAVKEAFVKAMGTGIRGEVNWRSMYVQHDEHGKPLLLFSAELSKQVNEKKLQVHISISDEQHYAVAHALIVTEDN